MLAAADALRVVRKLSQLRALGDETTGATMLEDWPTLLTIVCFVVFVGRALLRGIGNRRLLRVGRAAKGTVLTVTQTGARINEQPVLRFRIRVEPHGRSAFEATATKVTSLVEIPQVQPGQTVHGSLRP